MATIITTNFINSKSETATFSVTCGETIWRSTYTYKIERRTHKDGRQWYKFDEGDFTLAEICEHFRGRGGKKMSAEQIEALVADIVNTFEPAPAAPAAPAAPRTKSDIFRAAHAAAKAAKAAGSTENYRALFAAALRAEYAKK